MKKHPILLTIIFSINLICSNNSLYSNNLKDHLINTGLIVGGITFFVLLIQLPDDNFEPLPPSYYQSQLQTNPANFQATQKLEKAKKYAAWTSHKKEIVYMFGSILLTALGLYRIFEKKINYINHKFC